MCVRDGSGDRIQLRLAVQRLAKESRGTADRRALTGFGSVMPGDYNYSQPDFAHKRGLKQNEAGRGYWILE